MTDLFQQEPNWMIRTLAGFLLGYFFTYMVKGIHYIWRQVFTKNYLTGQWNSYYQTWENNRLVLKREQWTIKFGFNSKLKVNITTDEKLSYSGELLEERGHLIAILKAKEFDERIFGRYPIPIPGNDSTVVGLFLGTDWNSHAAAGINILSRTELNENEVSYLLKENTEVDVANGMIRHK
jgi:hypothetical protein